MKKLKFIVLIFVLFSAKSYSQECNDYYNYPKFINCRECINSHYKIYLNPEHVLMDLKDTLTFNVVFKRKRDYIISFCADQLYYPLHIRILNPETKEVLYDNATDNYIESIGVGISHTQNLVVTLNLKPLESSEELINSDNKVCVGFILQWKRILSKSNELYLMERVPK